MASKKQPKAQVHDITTERARRGRLPWSFDVDIAANRFVMRVRSDAKPTDIEAMAQAAETWGRTLLRAARQLRKAIKKGQGT